MTKKGKQIKRLQASSSSLALSDVVDFVDKMLPKIIHHRNQLKHYRTVIHKFKELNDYIDIDIDFSENLKVPVKYEPQSMHWSHLQITVHSGLMKIGDEKTYHPYLSHDQQHDQMFVQCVLEKMLSGIESAIESTTAIVALNISQQNIFGVYNN